MVPLAAGIPGDSGGSRPPAIREGLPPGIVADLHSIRLQDGATETLLFETTDFIIDACLAHPPGRAEGLLVLTAAEVRARRPRGGELYLVDITSPQAAVKLSPRACYNFWSVSVGDVDGDGAQDVALCTFSRTVLTPRYAQRLFIYSWNAQGDLHPLWRGSRLCRPYDAALLTDVTGDGTAELVSIEHGPNGGKLLVAYEWNQFGFWGLGQSDEFASLRLLRIPAAPCGPTNRALVQVDDAERPGARRITLELVDAGWQEAPAWECAYAVEPCCPMPTP